MRILCCNYLKIIIFCLHWADFFNISNEDSTPKRRIKRLKRKRKIDLNSRHKEVRVLFILQDQFEMLEENKEDTSVNRSVSAIHETNRDLKEFSFVHGRNNTKRKQHRKGKHIKIEIQHIINDDGNESISHKDNSPSLYE